MRSTTVFCIHMGKYRQNRTQFLELLDAGSKAIRENSGHARIIIHYAGLESSVDFYGELRSLDYDIVGISYYHCGTASLSRGSETH